MVTASALQSVHRLAEGMIAAMDATDVASVNNSETDSHGSRGKIATWATCFGANCADSDNALRRPLLRQQMEVGHAGTDSPVSI